MKKAAALGLLVALVGAAPAEAKQPWLSKREARAEAFRFTAPFVDLLDVNRTIETRMVPPRKCRRVSRRTVQCRFYGYGGPGDITRGSVRVHLQDDGLLGFLLDMPTPLPVLKRSLVDYS